MKEKNTNLRLFVFCLFVCLFVSSDSSQFNSFFKETHTMPVMTRQRTVAAAAAAAAAKEETQKRTCWVSLAHEECTRVYLAFLGPAKIVCAAAGLIWGIRGAVVEMARNSYHPIDQFTLCFLCTVGGVVGGMMAAPMYPILFFVCSVKFVWHIVCF
jgi:hypothetical protein